MQKNVTHPCPIDADIWLLGGQSNMQGYAPLNEQAKPNPNIMMFNMDNKWMVAQEPVHRIFEAAAPVHKQMALVAANFTQEQVEQFEKQTKTEPVGGVGPGLFFAQHLIGNGVKALGLIPCAHGGTSIEHWSPAHKDQGDNSLYGTMLNRVRMVGGKIKGLLWYQGESDTDNNTSLEFEQKTLNFIDSLRRDTNIPDLPVIQVQIGRFRCNDLPPQKGIELERVREAQRRIISLRKNVYMVTAIDQPLSDIVHVSFDGQKVLGKRMAEIALTYVYKKSGHATHIDLESVEVFNGTASNDSCFRPNNYLKIRFTGVNGKLNFFGRPADFNMRTPIPADPYIIPYLTELDPNDGSILIVRFHTANTPQTKLIYGSGPDPYMNILDEKGMCVPAFGPIEIPMKK
jgi:sialate O-acetylesterase